MLDLEAIKARANTADPNAEDLSADIHALINELETTKINNHDLRDLLNEARLELEVAKMEGLSNDAAASDGP